MVPLFARPSSAIGFLPTLSQKPSAPSSLWTRSSCNGQQPETTACFPFRVLIATQDRSVRGSGHSPDRRYCSRQNNTITGYHLVGKWPHGRIPFLGWIRQSRAILDGRTALAKRYSFIVEADLLKKDVKDDWTSFHDTARSLKVREAVRTHIIDALGKLLSDSRKDRKREALAEPGRYLTVCQAFQRESLAALLMRCSKGALRCPRMTLTGP